MKDESSSAIQTHIQVSWYNLYFLFARRCDTDQFKELEQSVCYQLGLSDLMVEDTDISKWFHIFSSEKPHIHDVRVVREAVQPKLLVAGPQSPAEIHPTPFFCWRPDATPDQPDDVQVEVGSDEDEANILRLNLERFAENCRKDDAFLKIYEQITPKDKDSIRAIPLLSSFAATLHGYPEPATGSPWSLKCHEAQNEVIAQKRDLMRRNFIELHSALQSLVELFFPSTATTAEPMSKLWGAISAFGKVCGHWSLETLSDIDKGLANQLPYKGSST